MKPLVAAQCGVRAGWTLALGVSLALVFSANAWAQGQGPWDRSLALEASGDFAGARRAIEDTFGGSPDEYDPCVRLAWLSLRMKDARHAVTLYRRARAFPNARPEATEGLVSSLTLEGYQALDRGDFATSRRDWSEAIALDRSNADARRGLDLVGDPVGQSVEAWTGRFTAAQDSSAARVLYVGVPVRVNAGTSARLAFRRVGSPSSAPGTTGVFGTQNELYGGVSVERGRGAVEGLAFVLHNVLDTPRGVALSARMGGRVGARAMVSVIHRSDGTNVQFAPSAFVWVSPHLALSAGVRVTHDPELSATDAIVGTTIRAGRAEVDAEAHLGDERWAFSPAGPTVLSFLDSTTHGVTMTASMTASPSAVVFVQVQVEQTVASGRYTSVAAGVRVSTRRH